MSLGCASKTPRKNINKLQQHCKLATRSGSKRSSASTTRMPSPAISPTSAPRENSPQTRRMSMLKPLEPQSDARVAADGSPLAMLKPRRTITGISAILLPFQDDGQIDWDGFCQHIHRTAQA